jgi:hypothetical protein
MRDDADRLRPDMLVRGVEDVDLDALAARGVRGILMDVDNTLTAWRSHEVPEAKRAWVESARGRFGLCLLSNTIFGKRLRHLGESLGIPYVGRWGLGRKPGTGGVMAALKLIGVVPAEAAIVGDQVFADILAGKRAGLTTILVDPVNPENEFLGTKLVRAREAPLRRRWWLEDEGKVG